jgi:hypothetical protein
VVRSGQYFIPARELWEAFNPVGFAKGVFVLFKGYIDESYDRDQKIFSLSCLIAKGKQFQELERVWKLHLRAKNKQLERHGRTLLTRYHASDCNARRGEFEDWSAEERNDFVLGLFGILRKVETFTIGYDVDLDNLCAVFPEFAKKRLELAYAVLTDFLMVTIAEDFAKHGENQQDLKFTLFHDQAGKYDSVILRQFMHTVASIGAPYESWFTTIAPLKWQDCVLLQPADLVAFEVFKEADQKIKGRESRKSFKALLEMDNFGIHTRSFVDKGTMLELRSSAEKRKSIREDNLDTGE